MKKITSILACLLALLFIVGAFGCADKGFTVDPNEYVDWSQIPRNPDEDEDYELQLDWKDVLFTNADYVRGKFYGTEFDYVQKNQYAFVMDDWASSVKINFEDTEAEIDITSNGWWGFAITQVLDPSSSDYIKKGSYLNFSNVSFIQFYIKSELAASDMFLQLGSLTQDPLRQRSLDNYTWNFVDDISDWTLVRIPVSGLQKEKMKYLAIGQRLSNGLTTRDDGPIYNNKEKPEEGIKTPGKKIHIKEISFLDRKGDDVENLNSAVSFYEEERFSSLGIINIDEGLLNGMELVFNEQFTEYTTDEDGNVIDWFPNWHFDLGTGASEANTDNTFAGNGGWGNNEKQSYTKDPKNVYIGDSTGDGAGKSMFITAIKDENGWTSARPVSRNKIEDKYGYIEMRAKITDKKGYWPAFWMLRHDIYDEKGTGWPKGGELDIMESSSKLWGRGVVKGTLHTQAGHGGSPIYLRQMKGFDDGTVNEYGDTTTKLADDFHTYGIYWTDKFITWYYDGIPRFTYIPTDYGNDRWPFDEDFYLILNLACGGNLGGCEPEASGETMEIDYIKWYQKAKDAPSFNSRNKSFEIKQDLSEEFGQ